MGFWKGRGEEGKRCNNDERQAKPEAKSSECYRATQQDLTFQIHFLIQRNIKTILQGFEELLAEMLCHSAFLGWAAEHFEGDSRNLAGMYLHNSVK